MHLADHNWLMEIKDPAARDGNRWTDVADGGNSGIFRLAVCVDYIVSMLGSLTMIGC